MAIPVTPTLYHQREHASSMSKLALAHPSRSFARAVSPKAEAAHNIPFHLNRIPIGRIFTLIEGSLQVQNMVFS